MALLKLTFLLLLGLYLAMLLLGDRPPARPEASRTSAAEGPEAPAGNAPAPLPAPAAEGAALDAALPGPGAAPAAAEAAPPAAAPGGDAPAGAPTAAGAGPEPGPRAPLLPPVLTEQGLAVLAPEAAPPEARTAAAAEAAAAEAAPGEELRRVTADAINVRSGPGTGHAVLGALLRGSEVRLTGARQGNWVEIRFGPEGGTGWVSARYLAP